MKLKDKNVAVLGFGVEGQDLVKHLVDQGAKVSVFDQKTKSELELDRSYLQKVRLYLGKHYLARGLLDYEVIFRSPGVYRYKKEISDAESSGITISSAVKLFFDLCPAKIIGITGTKGKGTTASLIYETLKTNGNDVHIAGNIGKPMLELLPKLKKTSWVVLELSSFQLMDIAKSPHIAVVLNITSDHMDWHKNLEEYVNAKKNIVIHQKDVDFSVINYDYKTPREFGTLAGGRVYCFSRLTDVKGSFVSKGRVILNINGKVIIGNTNDLLLRGEHNWENVTASVCASYLAGCNTEAIKKALFSFKGLEHRLELVGEVKGIKFYNDSYGTGPETVLAAANAFYEPITLVIGGFDKKLDYKKMVEVLSGKNNLSSVVLIGDIGLKLRDIFKSSGFAGKIIYTGKSKMDVVVKKALKSTPKGGVVVLAPGTSSFDMFKNYKDRGNQFKTSVKALK